MAAKGQGPRCDVCKQFLPATGEHVCKKPGPRPRGNAKWRSDSPEAKAYRADYARQWRGRNPQYNRRYDERGAQGRWRLRVATFIAYGGDPPACACCGEANILFLTLDHIDGTGAAERKANKRNVGVILYAKLRRAGWPPGYRILCWNCNCASGLYGSCPHDDDPTKPLRSVEKLIAVVR